MANPFSVRWLAGWTFQTVFMEGHLQVEAHGFGICLRTPVLPGESPLSAADRLVLVADRALETSRLKREVKELKALAPVPAGMVGRAFRRDRRVGRPDRTDLS